MESKNSCPIFVINLKKDNKKKKYMSEMAQMYAFNFNFIDAVYGKELEQNYVDEICDHESTMKIFNRPLFRGEVGVALSQMSIYKKMIDEDIEHAVILEDDVIVDSSLHEVMNNIDKLPQDWEIVLLGYHRNFISNRYNRISFRSRKKISENFKTVRFTDKMDGAFGYLINKKGAKKLYDILNTSIIKAVDNYIGDDNYINLYGIWPKCIHVNVSLESTINEERKVYNANSARNKNLSVGKRILQKIGVYKTLQILMSKYTMIKNELSHLPRMLIKPKKYKL